MLLEKISSWLSLSPTPAAETRLAIFKD